MYKLLPTKDDESLFFRLDGEAMVRHGAIGYLRADFGPDGRGFFTTWFNIQPHLNTPALKQKLGYVIASLRDKGPEPVFASRGDLEAFCAAKPGKNLNARGTGYTVKTSEYTFFFRCRPNPADFDVHCFAYDNRWLLPELAGKHKLPGWCNSILPSTGELISINRGQYAYFRSPLSTPFPDINRNTADRFNTHFGVTPAQEKAMLAGALYGWDSPATKPWNYDQDGNPRPQPPKRNSPER